MVKLNNIVKSFDGEIDAAVKGISLDIKEGEFLTILGPSGCGKTTTLRMIAGFVNADCGSIIIDNKDVTLTPPYERNANTVFQNYALFPHLNVYDNVAFGLNIKKVNKNEVKDRVLTMLKIVQMEGFENKMPEHLSGGQKQRVAIARAIINNPKVLLLDEPLGALDLKLRKQMQLELKHLQRKLGITFIFVTHDQEEALTMSDRICVMNNGLIDQIGTPEEIYEKPNSRFVADFIGETNIFEGTVQSVENGLAAIKLEDKQTVRIKNQDFKTGDSACFAIRPEKLKLSSATLEDTNCLKAVLKERNYGGSSLKTVMILPNGKEITINEPVAEKYCFAEGSENAFITWNFDKAVVIKA
jgi:spermidine/putrescine transport system ATP-binding protein